VKRFPKCSSSKGATRSFTRRKLIEPLNIVILRGKDASLGIAAQVARQEIVNWLMGLGKELFGSLFS
jgi:hypothetical protein